MVLTDIHTHSTHSPDGISTLAEMVSGAKAKGLSYLGIAEHFDYDYEALGVSFSGEAYRPIDEAAYFAEGRKLQKGGKDFHLLIGGEFGYADDARCFERYLRIVETYRPDFVVNSVHAVGSHDCYFPEFFAGKNKNAAYGRYLETVLKSLDAPYSYDVVGHLGYVSRNAPYSDRALLFSDFPDLIDEILRGIVSRGKILEVNSSARGAGGKFLPNGEILARYFELGGRQISFASDAHDVSRIADRRAAVCYALRKIGFTHVTVPLAGEFIKVEI